MKKKWISNTITAVLGSSILFLLGCQVSMLISERSNYGVPSLFGYSFMTVLTDSMVGEKPDSLPVGTGVVMQHVDPASVETGDVITFYSVELSSRFGYDMIISHRVREILQYPSSQDGNAFFTMTLDKEYSLNLGESWLPSNGESLSLAQNSTLLYRSKNVADASTDVVVPGESLSLTVPSYLASTESKRRFYTCGDNLEAKTCGSSGCSETYRDEVEQSYFIGKVTGHSDSFGQFLATVQSTWFIPVTVLVPLTAIAVFSAVDLVKQSRREAREEEQAIQNAMMQAGVDTQDEKAVILFTEKERYKLQIQKEMEKAKADERKRAERELRRQAHLKGKGDSK